MSWALKESQCGIPVCIRACPLRISRSSHALHLRSLRTRPCLRLCPAAAILFICVCARERTIRRVFAGSVLPLAWNDDLWKTLQNDGIGNVIKSQIKSLPCFTDRAAIRLRHGVKNGLTLSGVGPLKDPSIHRQTLQAAAAAERVGRGREDQA